MEIDVLVYEVGFGCQTNWEGVDPPDFDIAKDLLESKINNICSAVAASKKPLIYLTGSGNFREKLATLRPYKGTRSGDKPYHYDNLRAYMVGMLGAIVVDGMEADDALAIEQVKNLDILNGFQYYHPETIICSRDKDLKQVPGWHYSWEMGNQPSFGPEFGTGYGWIQLTEKNKLRGMGDKFFLAQCIMGDRVDNIGGIPGSGDAKAFKLLTDTKTYDEGLAAVVEAYKGFYGEGWSIPLLENGQLLYMVRELDNNGEPVLWQM